MADWKIIGGKTKKATLKSGIMSASLTYVGLNISRFSKTYSLVLNFKFPENEMYGINNIVSCNVDVVFLVNTESDLIADSIYVAVDKANKCLGKFLDAFSEFLMNSANSVLSSGDWIVAVEGISTLKDKYVKVTVDKLTSNMSDKRAYECVTSLSFPHQIYLMFMKKGSYLSHGIILWAEDTDSVIQQASKTASQYFIEMSNLVSSIL